MTLSSENALSGFPGTPTCAHRSAGGTGPPTRLRQPCLGAVSPEDCGCLAVLGAGGEHSTFGRASRWPSIGSGQLPRVC
jgi:hypothetical protein